MKPGPNIALAGVGVTSRSADSPARVSAAEVDEAYFGGLENKHRSKRHGKRGTFGKTIIAGALDRDQNKIAGEVVPAATKPRLRGFALSRMDHGAEVFTDDYPPYQGMPNHEVVNHRVGEYVRGKAHVNGMESFWAMLRRGYYGTYHRMSPTHLQRYVSEFAGRHSQRPMHTRDQMTEMVRGLAGKRLRYEDLIDRTPRARAS